MQKRTATVLTLDAGGTNFVFSAIRDFKEIAQPVTLPSHADDQEKCLSSIVAGFEQVARQIPQYDAISFAFPGPADYALGIIGDLPNFKAFNGGVPLGPMLQARFKVPVYINNDGDLFASGVALAGYLPSLNQRLQQAGSTRQFRNLIGITLGTGFGCGIVCNGLLLSGDNSCAAGIHNTLNPFNADWNAEESVSARAIRRVYAEQAGIPFDDAPMPKEIYAIAKGKRAGNSRAALRSFLEFGRALGASVANVLTIIDGIVVIGGGLSASWDLFSPSMFGILNGEFESPARIKMKRLSFKVFNLEDPTVFQTFARGDPRTLNVPGTDKVIAYDALPRTGVALSDIDASLAISLGAYVYARQKIQEQQ